MRGRNPSNCYGIFEEAGIQNLLTESQARLLQGRRRGVNINSKNVVARMEIKS
jgi:hypothetical protein